MAYHWLGITRSPPFAKFSQGIDNPPLAVVKQAGGRRKFQANVAALEFALDVSAALAEAAECPPEWPSSTRISARARNLLGLVLAGHAEKQGAPCPSGTAG
jgi:hypothetical protein